MPEPLHKAEIRPITERYRPGVVEPTPEQNEIHEHQGPTPVPIAQGEDETIQTAAPVVDAIPAALVKNPELVSIENVLEENMSSFFKSLNRAQQLEFKESGETTARSIQTIIHRGAYKLKDIVLLITRWLRSLPGINKFFLEQEAKIKADKIVDLYKQ